MENQHFTFLTMLEKELAAAKSLHQVLSEERSSLQASDLDTLKTINNKKIASLKQLQKLSQLRCEWMQKNDIALSANCIRNPLVLHSDPEQQEKLQLTWQMLADQFEANGQLTEILSEIVLQARKRTMTLLNLLKGKNDTENLYNHKGKEQSGSGRLGFVSA